MTFWRAGVHAGARIVQVPPDVDLSVLADTCARQRFALRLDDCLALIEPDRVVAYARSRPVVVEVQRRARRPAS